MKNNNEVTKEVDTVKQGLVDTKICSPCRPAQKRLDREDISLGSVPWPAMKVAKEGKEMEVDTPGKTVYIASDKEEALALFNSGMKEAEAMDEDLELETPTLARGGDHLLQTSQALSDGIHQDVPSLKLKHPRVMDIALPSKDKYPRRI